MMLVSLLVPLLLPQLTPVAASIVHRPKGSRVSLLSDAGKPGNPYELLTRFRLGSTRRRSSSSSSAEEEPDLNSLTNEDLAGLDPHEILAVDKNLIILRGFNFKASYDPDPPGPPIDDYRALPPHPPPPPEPGTVFYSQDWRNGSVPFLPPPGPPFDSTKETKETQSPASKGSFTRLYPARSVEYYYPTVDRRRRLPPGPSGPGIYVLPPDNFFAPLNGTTDIQHSRPLSQQPHNLPKYYESSANQQNRLDKSQNSTLTKRTTSSTTFRTISPSPKTIT